jgi:hypothetical protein
MERVRLVTMSWEAPVVWKMLRSSLKNAGVKLGGEAGKRLEEALFRLSQDRIDEQVIWDARDEFASNGGRYGRRKPHAARATGTAARSPRVEPAPSVTGQTQEAATGLPAVLPERITQWNELVPEALRVSRWSANQPQAQLREAELDADFTEDFVKICARASKCHATGRLTPTFAWLFEYSKGKVNWWRMANGLFAWAEEPKDGSPGSGGRFAETPTSLIAAKFRAKIAAREAAKLKELKEPSDGKDGREHRAGGGDADGKLGVPERAAAVGSRLEGTRQGAA